ncbi:MAG: zinc metallopeptidase [Dinghuibacter sp.]|nr:zinc metallopeptidase [Dinghuibacter sp.]
MPNEIFIVSIVFMGISMLVSMVLKSRFTKYTKVPLSSGLTGKEIAEKMLRENGIYDVQVVSVQGFLSDHYNPANKTVNLSPDVYNGTSVAAAAVSAHECGHAVQHATAYQWLQFRSKMVPITQISTNLSQWILMIGLGLLGFGGGNPTVLLVGIGLFSISTIFSLVTLPVEFDASKRALAWLDNTNVARGEEHAKAKDALKWAATTYVVAALASLVMLLQYIMIYLNSRDRN